MKRVWFLLGVVVALTIVAVLGFKWAGTSSDADPVNGAPSGELLIQEALVETVDVRIAESFPVQVYADVTGVLGDGCTTLHAIEQSRDGNKINVAILTERPANAVCTMIAVLLEESVKLEGEFPPGRYELTVNQVTTEFEVQ